MFEYSALTCEVLELTMEMIPMRGETNKLEFDDINFEELYVKRDFLINWCESAGLKVIRLDEGDVGRFPALAVVFPENLNDGVLDAEIALLGHVDVVQVQDESQFTPRRDGDLLFGRGAADMLAAVSTHLVWMKRRKAEGGEMPNVATIISFTEENGSPEGQNAATTYDVLRNLYNADIKFTVCSERTGEMKSLEDRPKNVICVENAGVRRFTVECEQDPDSGRLDYVADQLKIQAELVKTMREDIHHANSSLSSERMGNESNWRTSFNNPDGEFQQVYIPFNDNNVKFFEYNFVGSDGRHVSESSIADPQPIESAFDFVKSLQDRFCDVKLQILSVKFGSFGRFNAGKSFTVRFAVNSDFLTDALEIDGGLKELTEEELRTELPSSNSVRLGYDVRPIQEHTGLVEEKIDDLIKTLKDSDDFKWGIQMMPWKCPDDDFFLLTFIDAFHEVYGSLPDLNGKIFGNDAHVSQIDDDPQGVVRAVIFGPTGFGPHRSEEALLVSSIDPFYDTLDKFIARASEVQK